MEAGGTVVRFIYEIGFTVKLGKEEAYQTWLAENEAKIAAAQPPGTKYLGTFAVIFTSEKTAGFYRSFSELDSYAVIDTYAALMKDEKSDLGRLMRDESQFVDYDPNAQWSNGLYKLVVDAAIWDPK
ncbi:MAG: hypothetical protein WD508_07650 [Chloroflexota bacterium]